MVRRMIQRIVLLGGAGLAAGLLAASPARAQMTLQECLKKNYTYNVCKNYPTVVGAGKPAPKPGQSYRTEDEVARQKEENEGAGLRPEAIWPAYGCWAGGDLKACQAAQKSQDTSQRPPLLDFPNLLQDNKYSLDLPTLDSNMPTPPDDKLTLPRPGGPATP
jgi:hypothetical protein